jgi:hypothetical protein
MRYSANQKIKVGLLQWGIILLTVITALVHFNLAYSGIVHRVSFLSVLFLLNGLGYLSLLAALYLPIGFLAGYRTSVRWALMGFAALTVILWVIMGGRFSLAYIDKAVEIVLIVLLWFDSRS